MLLAVALLLLVVLGGAVASYAYDDDAGLIARLAYGAASGLAVLGLVGFAAFQLGSLTVATVVAAVVVALPLLALARPRVRDRIGGDLEAARRSTIAAVRRPSLATLAPALFGIGTIVFLAVVFDRAMFTRDGSIYTGYVNNLGDLPFHLQVTASFALGHNVSAEDPMYAGTGFTYPYSSDFVAAMLVGLGASFRDALLAQNMALGLALVALLHRFTSVVTRDRLAAYLAPIIVLFSGGLGWIVFLADAQRSEHGIIGTLGSLTRDYTITGDGPYRWGNAIATLLVTQRSLLAGVPLALVVFVLLWKLVHRDAPGAIVTPRRPGDVASLARDNRLAVAAGVLTGLLPLVHAHTFIVVMGTAFLLGLLFRQSRDGRWVGWAIFVVVSLLLAVPQLWWTTHASIANAGSFFGIELGWDHGTTNIAWFWLLNTGLFIPLAALGSYLAWTSTPAQRSLVLLTIAFGAWFVIPNVVKLAPWVWDNIKVLFLWFVGWTPVVALAVSRLFRRGSLPRAAGAVALAILVLAGGLDMWRVVSGQTEYREFDPDGVAIAGAITSDVPARALVLHAPTYNVPVYLTGRRSLLGYTGQVWSRGLDYVGREDDIKKIYDGAPDAAALLAQYAVDYVLVSPLERAYMPVNDKFFATFREVAAVGPYALYEVPKS
ncbi:MAG: hypothetical protein ACJ77B_08895 [Chloroflexota bacterium]